MIFSQGTHQAYPEWWGAVGDGRSDDSREIMKAYRSVGTAVVQFAPFGALPWAGVLCCVVLGAGCLLEGGRREGNDSGGSGRPGLHLMQASEVEAWCSCRRASYLSSTILALPMPWL